MKSSAILAVVSVLAVAAAASASGPKAGSLYGEEVIVTTSDGIEWTGAKIDSILADYPKAVREAFKKTGLAWQGLERHMTFETLAAHCAPVLWFSPDEPLLDGAAGRDIRQPQAFPFEDQADSPVAYYRIRTILKDTHEELEGEVLNSVDPGRRATELDLELIDGIDLDYFFFYPAEAGFGAHKYDVESVEMKIMVVHARAYPELGYWVVVQKVTAKAHGVMWYDNNLETDRFTRFPIHIIVEEGKHASCTDKNGDGHYSPGYDVNKRVNDAWGVRDVMATGGLYSGGFAAWMAKPRHPEHRVIPPIPLDNPHREQFVVDGVFAPDNAVYELRPFPRLAPALAYDPQLKRFVDKGDEDWPEVDEYTEFKKLGRWVEAESFVKTTSIAFRYDGDPGISFAFPLLVVKSVSDPVGGGWFVNRIYFKDHNLRDFSWNILYTPSASRWIDGYFTFGWEWDDDGTRTESHAMTEVGIKFRFNMAGTPLNVLSKATDFWGLRLGVKNLGIWEWDHIGYAVEVGAGVW